MIGIPVTGKGGEDLFPYLVGEQTGERGVLAQLDCLLGFAEKCVDDPIDTAVEDLAPGGEISLCDTIRSVQTLPSIQVRAGFTDCGLRVAEEIADSCAVEPQGTLSFPGWSAAAYSVNRGPRDSPMGPDPDECERSPVAEINNMLAGHTQ